MANPKEFLNSRELIERRISAKENDIQQLKAIVLRITPYYSEGGGSNHNNDKFAECMAKIIDYENELLEDVEELVDQKKRISDVIDQITDSDEFKVIYCIYVEGKNLEKASVEMNMTYRNACYIHGHALRTVKRILEEDETE